jgi:hypothetical protein
LGTLSKTKQGFLYQDRKSRRLDSNHGPNNCVAGAGRPQPRGCIFRGREGTSWFEQFTEKVHCRDRGIDGTSEHVDCTEVVLTLVHSVLAVTGLCAYRAIQKCSRNEAMVKSLLSGHRAVKDTLGSGGVAASILNLSTRWR